ncbi:hypothetical protein BM221_003060 [Beauveria bassiana]|uniref:Uncharacterized protein n=1 Tax=Beauveria bassiana TaxID=176275 RepID=A0A2N6NTM0_BEABA|nr:hypothetical protein BM221_003060 [Beauveria bassiana]
MTSSTMENPGTLDELLRLHKKLVQLHQQCHKAASHDERLDCLNHVWQNNVNRLILPEWNPQVMAKASTNVICLLKPAGEATLLPDFSVLSELVSELNRGGKSLSIPHGQAVRSNKAR